MRPKNNAPTRKMRATWHNSCNAGKRTTIPTCRACFLMAYIENQKRHHADGTTDPALEQTDEASDADVKEP